MPLVSFKPTKARLVIENDKDSVLVMKVAVTNFAMILPIEVPEARENGTPPAAEPWPVESMATNAQVAELVDDLLVFQSETRNMLYAMVAVVAVAVALALVFGIVQLVR